MNRILSSVILPNIYLYYYPIIPTSGKKKQRTEEKAIHFTPPTHMFG